MRPLWAFVRGWSNLWQIPNFFNWRRNRLQVSRSYGTPLRTSSMLEGDVPQEQMTKHIKLSCLFSFVKKVSENWGTSWGWQKQRQKHNIMVAPCGKDELNWAGHLHHKQDRKELECDPVWHPVAVSRVRPCATDGKEVEFLVWHPLAGQEWDTAPQANPAHTGRSTQRTHGKVAVSSSHEQEYCTTKRDVSQRRACP